MREQWRTEAAFAVAPPLGAGFGRRKKRLRDINLIVDLAETGVGLIVVSSELEEVIGLADRSLIIADGRIVGELARAEASEEIILRMIAAAQAEKSVALRAGSAA